MPSESKRRIKVSAQKKKWQLPFWKMSAMHFPTKCGSYSSRSSTSSQLGLANGMDCKCMINGYAMMTKRHAMRRPHRHATVRSCYNHFGSVNITCPVGIIINRIVVFIVYRSNLFLILFDYFSYFL